MIEVHTISTARHIAYVEYLTGTGVLLSRDPLRDGEPDLIGYIATMDEIEALKGQACDPLTMDALERADWLAMLAKLDARGWELVDDDELIGHAGEGVGVTMLHGRDRVIDEPTLEQLAETGRAVHSAAGVTWE